MMTTQPLRPGALAALSLLALAALTAAVRAAGEDGAPPEAPASTESVRIVGPDGEPIAPPAQSEVERYCTSIADEARDARYAAQTRELAALEAAVAVRLDELEAKRAEYQAWLEERRAFLDGANSILLDIYAQMKPDAAAGQLAGLDRAAAAALLARLKSRQASAILSEMDAEAAAEIAAIIAQKTAEPASAGVTASVAASAT